MAINSQASALSPQEQSDSTDQDRPRDVREIMAQIRERVRSEVDGRRDERGAFQPRPADFDTSQHKAGELLHSEELRYLNGNYAYQPRLDLDAVQSHRKGPVARLIVGFKRRVLAVVWDYLFKDYFEREKQFQARVVRYLNDVSKYVDARDASNFWEVIKKIDVDTTRALDRIERINDEQMASIRTSERHFHDALNESLTDLRASLDSVKATLAKNQDQIGTLESVAAGLEGIVRRAGATGAELPRAAEQPVGECEKDYSYLLLENRFRGSEELIRERLQFYVDLFPADELPVIDIGCGRGELVQLFGEQGVTAYGVDLDQGMLDAAHEKGLDARLCDGLAHLATLADNSLSGVIAIQVVEHLTRQQIERLCELCNQKVRPGGRVIFETINPRSLLALSSNYFRDPTHIWPLHPDTLSYTMSLTGLEIEKVCDLSPVPEEGLLKEVPLETYMSPRWSYTVTTLNRNIKQLNELIYGFQDYCVIGRVRAD